MVFKPSKSSTSRCKKTFKLSLIFTFLTLFCASTTFAGNFDSGVTLDTNTHYTGYRAYSEGDIDNNGTPDVVGEASSGVLAVTKDLSGTPSYEVQSHLAAESGNFYGSAVADLDGDGDLDLVTAGPNGSTTSPNNVYYWDSVTNNRYEKAGSTYTLTGNTTFFYGTAVVIGNFDSDNKPDVIWFGADQAYIGINSTTTADDIQFSSITDTGLAIDNNTFGNFSAATGDFNDDNNLDFIITDNSFVGGLWGGYYQVGYGDGNGGFTLSTPTNSGDGYQPTAVAVGDFNSDGKDDFVLTRSIFPDNGQLIVYLRNAGNTDFDAATIATSDSGTLKGLQVSDLNNDGYDDIAVQSNSGSSMEIYFNQGDGTFPSTPSLTLNNGYNEQFFLTDINLDGLKDILTLTNNNITYYPQTGDNLFTNPGAETGDFTGWTKVDGGDGWGIFNNYNDAHGGYRAFIASWLPGTLSQEVDLVAKGYSTSYLDSAPTITVSTYVKGSWPNYSDPYRVTIELRDTSHNVIASYNSGNLTGTNSWAQITQTFNSYGSGVRYIYLQQRGYDAEAWAGQYGAAFDSASAYIESLSSYDVTYTAGANGSLTGSTSQTIESGADGTAVTPVPDTGYVFDSWDDGSVLNPRIETDVRANYSATANFIARPPAPTDLTADNLGGGDVDLNWVNPVNVDFDSIMIRRSTSAFPTDENDGTLVTENITTTNYTDSGLADGEYYYSIFAKNSSGIYSVALTISVIVAQDATAPTVVLSSSRVNSGGSTTSNSIPFIATFSEDISTFSEASIHIINGVASNITEVTPNTRYSFNIIPTKVGTISVTIGSGAVEDSSGNKNTASATYTFDYMLSKSSSSGSSSSGGGGGGGSGSWTKLTSTDTTKSSTDVKESDTDMNTQDTGLEQPNTDGEISTTTEENPFYDIVNHWSKDFVLELYKMHVIQGRAPHFFVPDGTLTNAEAVKIGLLVFGYRLDANDFRSGYTDLDEDAWYIPYVRKAKKEGFISGTKFHPDDPINRIDLLVMYLKMADKIDENSPAAQLPAAPFKDISQTSSVAKYVNYAYAKDIIIGRGTIGETFEPLSTVTRGETAKLAIKIKEL